MFKVTNETILTTNTRHCLLGLVGLASRLLLVVSSGLGGSSSLLLGRLGGSGGLLLGLGGDLGSGLGGGGSGLLGALLDTGSLLGLVLGSRLGSESGVGKTSDNAGSALLAILCGLVSSGLGLLLEAALGIALITLLVDVLDQNSLVLEDITLGFEVELVVPARL
jgi:hypothetical protein